MTNANNGKTKHTILTQSHKATTNNFSNTGTQCKVITDKWWLVEFGRSKEPNYYSIEVH